MDVASPLLPLPLTLLLLLLLVLVCVSSVLARKEWLLHVLGFSVRFLGAHDSAIIPFAKNAESDKLKL